jgi:hypothetical protein
MSQDLLGNIVRDGLVNIALVLHKDCESAVGIVGDETLTVPLGQVLLCVGAAHVLPTVSVGLPIRV